MLKECNKHTDRKRQETRHSNHPNDDKWFEDMISNLRVDQLLMQTETIDKDRGDMYRAMMEKNDNKVHLYAREASSMYFISNLVSSYLHEVIERKIALNKLALVLLNSKILVWAEIKDDDEDSEDSLILSAAKVNHEFCQYGFHLSYTIVDESDNIDIPEHYKEVSIKRA